LHIDLQLENSLLQKKNFGRQEVVIRQEERS
jgi:uncharacterized protein YqgQ